MAAALPTDRCALPFPPPLCPRQGPEGRPGLPVSVLLGHGGPVAFLDFHPALPDALVSASFDGTLRLWRARDAAAPPIVLTVDPQRFGLTGTAITRCAAGLVGPAGMRYVHTCRWCGFTCGDPEPVQASS